MANINNLQERILKLIIKEKDNLYLAKIYRKLGSKKGWTHKNLTQLVDKKYLQKTGGSPKFYSITKKGTSYVQGFSIPQSRMHGIQLTIPILRKPIGWITEHSKFEKMSDTLRMKGWKTEIRGRWEGDFMMVTPKSITIHLSEFWNKDPRINALNALHRCKEFCIDMESINPGLKLGKAELGSVILISAQEHALGLPNNPNIESYTGRTFVIDYSNGYPEVEFKNNKSSTDHMAVVSELIDSIAEGDLTLDDIRYNKEDRKIRHKDQVMKRAFRLAKVKWKFSDHSEFREWEKKVAALEHQNKINKELRRQDNE